MTEKEFLQSELENNVSVKKISERMGVSFDIARSRISKYNLSHLVKPNHIEYNDVHYFNKIDTKEKAYLIGFLLGDGYIAKDGHLTLTVQLSDIEIIEFMQQQIGGRIVINTKIDRERKIFPHALIKIGNSIICKDILRLFGGRLKPERHIPIVRQDLEKYLLLGFFDAEGCITWGIRKDRNRVWQKISFTSQYKMLTGIQNILLKNGIATRMYQPKNSDCYIIEFCNKKNVCEFLNDLYKDKEFVVLKRKYEKSINLRLELGEFGES